MGERGPAPKRDAERRRRNKPEVPTTTVDIAALVAEPVVIPVADPDWEPVTLQWYESLARSGQAVFYEPSDWATAYLLAEVLDRELKPQPVVIQGSNGEPGSVEMHTLPLKGASLNALLKGFTALMVTEGDRRRLSIELERKRGADAAAAAAAGIPDISQKRASRLAGGHRA